MNITLQGKVAVITGAASGVGLATTREFLSSDARAVIAVDVKDPPSEDLQRLSTQYGDRLVYVCGDVGLESTAQSFTRVAGERFGRIDILFNNAGVGLVGPIHEHTSEQWDRVMNTNVKSIFWAAKSVIPMMIQQGGGVILNTGSISGHVGIAGQGVYGPSKGAVHQMTKQMAIEYADRGIRVNAIALGTVDTPMLQQAAETTDDPARFLEGLKSMHPIGRIATAEEAAKFVTFLASDAASFCTGAILSLDGGFIAR
ncbi:glucose 1-dehydrogenase [Roseiconus nitratireducens]|uniref:Glucose 1-dehydrogenase n=1 Tax=Roseiconus nitratireducens TaxID=2605748 RepID=A0A5M6CUT5_9BACT|nr:glucose 1-dehydrogenase [Roseiconus nitratireducens]KAA5539008.1 glucose 1-dehydrogenase [Roseiconus nitratireducens]